MDSLVLLENSFGYLGSLNNCDSELHSSLDKLFKNLINLKNKYKINFDLESFTRILPDDPKVLNLDTDFSGFSESGSNTKKTIKKLLNFSLLHLIKTLRDEKHLDICLDILVDLLDSEYHLAVEVKGIKILEFLDLFLLILFLGNTYNLGITQHFLLNSKYVTYLPYHLLNTLKNSERSKLLNKYLNGNHSFDSSLFNERFLIFLSKLNTPDKLSGSTDKQDKILKIPKKELALKTFDSAFHNSTQNNHDSLDTDSDLTDDDAEAEDTSDDGVDYELYGNNYVKLWEHILNDFIRSVDNKSLVIILECLPKFAFPYINNPLRVANFLYNNLNNNNEDIVINSLNCLFELILYYNLTDQLIQISPTPHNITDGNSLNLDSVTSLSKSSNEEFDWFYNKLYELIDFKYLSTSSSTVLILLIEKALNSSMLPNTLVSFFIKKLLKTSTVLETNKCNCLVIISLNMLQKHRHNLLYMIHSPETTLPAPPKPVGPNTTINTSSVDNKDSKDDSTENLTNKDNVNSTNLEQNNAKELFLHELYLLLRHFNNDTAKIVGVFFTDLSSKIGLNIKDFIHSPSNKVFKGKNTCNKPFRTVLQNTTKLTSEFLN
ncbi:CBF/Mak21 family protein [Theileria parva strain Muguga]|uniref:CCAAT-binding factor domain-containing protein n=1 Tax=Theileria parva TaxID=5875 RepID=Q4N3D3_THEPA|nr:CBF/Mak21 family protein [Theileria parva strain Muguga]EAN31406.1 CBF/Mak21 family protein [Theileria parva strain Muguga]|eukprot:XP_763689.1 hypothetical protein [Theileria parva strain Muguga]